MPAVPGKTITFAGGIACAPEQTPTVAAI
jgi:hypothetical protein